MIRLRRVEEKKKLYHGFHLHENDWYGVDTETGAFVASTGAEAYGFLSVYFLEGETWTPVWLDNEETLFEFEGVPPIDTKNKMSFNKWLSTEIGISPEEYDENYSGHAAQQLEDEYDSYYYDGLPKAVYTRL